MILASKLKNERTLVVCDPFLGSGSAAIAAIKNNCKFIGGDISKTAIKISTKRIDTYLKKKIDILEEKTLDTKKKKIVNSQKEFKFL